MERLRMPREFGFTTPSYLPPERARPAWKTLLFGGLLALVPIVGAGMSAVYIDRRQSPGTFDVVESFKTAVIQIVALALLALFVWLVFGVMLGIGIELNPRLMRPAS